MNKPFEVTQALRESFASIRVLEHPVNPATVVCDGYDRTTSEDVPMPEGWELIHVGAVDKIASMRDYSNKEKEVQVLKIPIYVIGRRRDDFMEDLRVRAESAREDAAVLSRAECEYKHEIIKLKEELTYASKAVAEAQDATEALGVRALASEERGHKLEQGLADKDAEIKRLQEKVLAK